jgi:crotonobetainyl-CoA:carnitine CoA-transferase CaiB-like acyl-CoA transferase
MNALEGLKVIELATVAAGPMTGRFLADWGAEVIKIEHQVRGDMMRYFQREYVAGKSVETDIPYLWENYNRNKKSVTVDISKEKGREIVLKLVKDADVLISNMRPREFKKFRIEYETLCKLNPRLIFASITGYGKKGPDADLPGFDVSGFWARSGIMNVLPEPDMPPPFSRPTFGDNITGMSLALGIMTALYTRDKTGVGQEVDVSLFNTGLWVLTFDIAGALVTGQDAPNRTRREVLNPLANIYQTKDDRWLYLALVTPDPYWSRACKVLGRGDLENHSDFSTFNARQINHTKLYDIVSGIFRSKTMTEWEKLLNTAGLPWAKAQKPSEVIVDPQAIANETFVEVDHPTLGKFKQIANPVKLSKTPATVRTTAPEFGQHTEEVLLTLGYTWEDLAELKQDGVIA